MCRLAERAAALEARLASAEAEADSARESLRQMRVDNATLQSALQAARAERNALNAAIRSVLAAQLSQFIDTLYAQLAALPLASLLAQQLCQGPLSWNCGVSSIPSRMGDLPVPQ